VKLIDHAARTKLEVNARGIKRMPGGRRDETMLVAVPPGMGAMLPRHANVIVRRDRRTASANVAEKKRHPIGASRRALHRCAWITTIRPEYFAVGLVIHAIVR